jgi:protein-disulfide isomerase
VKTRALFLALAVASFSTAACNAEKGADKGATAASTTTVAPVKPPANGDWSTVTSETTAGGFLMGNPNAKVKIVEFGSMTCPHCREFDEEGVKPLIDNYVKSGKVSYEFRNFVRDPFDVAASLVARCGGATSFFGMTRGLYKDQPQWVGKIQAADQAAMQQIQNLPPNQQFGEIAKLAGLQDWAAVRGLPADKSAACLADQTQVDRLVQMQNDAVSSYNIPGTPGFLLNGTLQNFDGSATVWTQLEKNIKAALGG